jgi:hypothetical protein
MKPSAKFMMHQGMPDMRRSPAYLAIALVFAAIVTWGFWQSYFAPLIAGTVERPWIVHLHAAVFVGWVLLLVAQAALATAGRTRLHGKIGLAGMAYGALVFLVGVMVSIGAPALRVRAGEFPLEVGGMVAILSLADLLLFGVFLAFAFASRLQPRTHKQWVIAATAALGGAAVGRVLKTDSLAYLIVWLSPVLALIAIDLVSRRRLGAVPLVSGGLIVASFFKQQLFAAPIWDELGRALVRPFV